MQMAVNRGRRECQLKVDGPVGKDEANVDPSFTVRYRPHIFIEI